MNETLARLGIEPTHPGAAGAEGFFATSGRIQEIHSPGTGELLGRVQLATGDAYERVVRETSEAFLR
ncbi:MAG: aldehyde dehydrogenase family protein, partial [Pseudomonadota bacterium]